MALPRPEVPADALVDLLLSEATRAPELWNQKSYLARAFSLDPAQGILDEGIVPLAQFVDEEGPAAVAIAVETDDMGDIHPAVYVRAQGRPAVETLLTSHPLHDFRSADNRHRLSHLLRGATAGAVEVTAREDLERINAEIVSCTRCPRLVAWREEAARAPAGAIRRPDVLGAAGAGLRRSAGARAASSASRRRPTAATARGASSPAIARATSCSRVLHAPASQTSRPRSRSATA